MLSHVPTRRRAFYIDLFSNATSENYPSNSASAFTIELPRTILLEGSGWEVALAQYSLPTEVKSIPAGGKISVSCFPQSEKELREGIPLRSTKIYTLENQHFYPTPTRDNEESVTKSPIVKQAAFDTEMYCWEFEIPHDRKLRNTTEMMQYITSVFQNSQTGGEDLVKQKALYDIVRRRIIPTNPEMYQPPFSILSVGKNTIWVILRDDSFYVSLNAKLARMLGIAIGEHQWICFTKPGVYQLEVLTPHIKRGRPSLMHIYCDVVEPLIVSNVSVPLLKTIPLDESIKTGGFIAKDVITRQYLPVRGSTFQTVRVEIRDTFGKLIHFDFGLTYLRLHFQAYNGSS